MEMNYVLSGNHSCLSNNVLRILYIFGRHERMSGLGGMPDTFPVTGRNYLEERNFLLSLAMSLQHFGL
jgi:hypothetical protein